MSNAINPKRTSTSALSKTHLQSLLYLCDALASLSNPMESALILRDLFSPQELITIANRLHIAALLINGDDYEDIQESLKVGKGTIARISTWLETSGDGYRLVTQRTCFRDIPSTENTKSKSVSSAKSQHIWPATLVKELHELMSNDNACKILSTLADAKQKPALFQNIDNSE